MTRLNSIGRTKRAGIKRARAVVAFLVWVLAACATQPSAAFAYVDPGSGSMFLQLLLASLLGGLYALKAYWRRIRAWFSGQRDEPKPNEGPPHNERDD